MDHRLTEEEARVKQGDLVRSQPVITAGRMLITTVLAYTCGKIPTEIPCPMQAPSPCTTISS